MIAKDTAGLQRRRHLRELMRMPRSALASHYRRKVSDLTPSKRFPRLVAFLPQHLWPWVTSYLAYVCEPRHSFMVYPESGDRGVYDLRGANGARAVRISIAGDWGTGTAEAARVAHCMQHFAPDYTIHLGDVYYVGAEQEILENCFGKSRNGFQGVNWPKGAIGSFALNSNHEMYANGTGYFDVLIPALGVPQSRDRRQLTSFFCLQNEQWRIIALDTGYNSTGFPILGQIPPLRWIPGIGPTCKLEAPLMDWLRKVVDPIGQPRATILLSHHPYFSAFGESYPRPAHQLARILPKQDVIWIWGHEHRLAIYERHANGPIHAYGRCVGHGGMPVDLGEPRRFREQIRWLDRRVYETIDGTKIGFNGFLNLTIEGNSAHFDYRDLNDKLIQRESFKCDDGRIAAQVMEDVDVNLGPGERM